MAERHNGAFGGCWCTWFQTMSAGKEHSYDENRSLRRRLVDECRAHTALVYDGDEAVAWCEYGSPAELPNIYHRRRSQFLQLDKQAATRRFNHDASLPRARRGIPDCKKPLIEFGPWRGGGGERVPAPGWSSSGVMKESRMSESDGVQSVGFGPGCTGSDADADAAVRIIASAYPHVTVLLAYPVRGGRRGPR